MNLGWQRQLFHERNEVGMTPFENRRRGERDFVHGERGQFFGHGFLPRQETAPNPVGHWTQAQIETRGLKLALLKRRPRSAEPAFMHSAVQPLNRQDSRWQAP